MTTTGERSALTPSFESCATHRAGSRLSTRTSLSSFSKSQCRMSRPPPMLAESDARLDEPLTTVGYGNDERGAALHGERRFNTSRVVSLSEDRERILLSSPGHLLYQNDSGGPCLRERPEGDVLVGISNRGLNNESSCLSTYFHREWLRKQLLEIVQLPK